MAIFNNSIIPAETAAAADDVVTKSLRFNRGDSPKLTRTFGTPTSQKKVTISFWMKLSEQGDGSTGYCGLFFAGTGGAAYSAVQLEGGSNNQIRGDDVSGSYRSYKTLSRSLRDMGAWMHVCYVVDTTLGPTNAPAKFYINGVRDSTFDSSVYELNYALNVDTFWSASGTELGIGLDNSSGAHFGGYLADIHYIDGQALDHTYFATEDATTGQWKPKAFSGTYGDNGFHLDFEDDTDIGNDVSGKGNDFTTTNLAASDIVNDRPTSNFCTWNPISGPPRPATTFSEGNLKVVGNYSTHFPRVMGTMLVSSGKWFHEIRCGSTHTTTREYGFKGHQTSWPVSGGSHGLSGGSAEWDTNAEFAFSAYHGGIKFSNSSSPETTGTTWGTAGDVIGLALDLDSSPRTFRVFKDGSEVGTATDIPTGGSDDWVPAMDPTSGSAQTSVANFGQDATFNGNESGTTYTTDASDDDTGGEFTMQPPAGYKAWTTKNLTPTIAKPKEYFDVLTYASSGAKTFDNGDTTMQPDLVWVKARGDAYDHELTDSVRGVEKALSTNDDGLQSTDSTGLIDFDADGFEVGAGTNYQTSAMVAWCWRKHITSGFDIVEYTADDSQSSQEIALTSGFGTPEMVIVKVFDNNSYEGGTESNDWYVWHHKLTDASYYILLNGYGAEADSPDPGEGDVINVGNGTVTVAGDPMSGPFLNEYDAMSSSTGRKYIIYAMKSVAGFSKVGSYLGTGVSGNFVYTGFRPKFLLYTHSSGSGHGWHILDDKREPYNPLDTHQQAGESLADAASPDFDFLSNGFRIYDTTGPYNETGEDYIFYAVGQSSKYASAR